MKTLCVVLGVLLVSTVVCRAQATAYPIKLQSGLINQDQSGNTVSISFRTGWLLGDASLLMLVVDQDNRELRLVTTDSETNLVATLAQSAHCAILPDGTFNGILEFTDLTVSNGLFSTTGDGAMLIHGRQQSTSTGKIKLSGNLEGALNDPVNGNPDAPDETIKAKIQPNGKGFDADEFGL